MRHNVGLVAVMPQEFFVTYSVGTKVIYPAHGIAKIVAKTKRTIDGEEVNYLELVVPRARASAPRAT